MAAPPIVRRHAMKSFVTDKTEYTLKQVFEDFGDKLPRIYRVTRGYTGHVIDKCLKKGQMVRLQCTSSRDRIAARAITKCGKIRYFSFYEYTSVVNSKSDKHAQTILAMIEDKTLPCTIGLKRSQGGVSEATKLQFLNHFDERHLAGNIIDNDVLDLEVLYIPTFLSRIRLVEVIGLNESPSAWDNFQKQLTKKSESLEYDTQFTRISIAVHKRVADVLVGSETGVKRYIELKEFHDMCMTEDMYEQKARHVRAKAKKGEELTEDKIYEEVASLYASCEESDAEDEDTVKKGNDDTDEDVIQTDAVEMSDMEEDEEAKQTADDDPPPLPPRRYRDETPPETNDSPLNRYTHTNCASVSPVRRIVPTEDDSDYEEIDDSESLPMPPKFSSVRVEENAAAHSPATYGQMIGLPEVKNKTDVQKLTITQLCGYLHILKLDKLISTCKEQLIDGEILVSLSIEDLIHEFKLSRLEATRLDTFTKQGHIAT